MFQSQVCMCSTCVPGAHGGQQITSDPLELKLWRVLVTIRDHLKSTK
ncbi:hypothetical protein LEMLEM_LOCUS2743, partial [Lemmus lemmus]